MQVTKVRKSNKGSHIGFIAVKELEFNLSEEAVGYLPMSDPSKWEDTLRDIQANLHRFSLGEQIEGSSFYKVVLS